MTRTSLPASVSAHTDRQDRLIWLVPASRWSAFRDQLPDAAVRFAQANSFQGQDGRLLAVPDQDGNMIGVLIGLGDNDRPLDPFFLGRYVETIPEGHYAIDTTLLDDLDVSPDLMMLGWVLGHYRFTRYRQSTGGKARLDLPEKVDAAQLSRMAAGVFLARDLINTPANECGPAELEAAARSLALTYHAQVNVILGEDLLDQNFPLIHAVGRASPQAPRLIEMTWCASRADDAVLPQVTLVGKGVCFDTGGLNIKPDSGMLLMKKDMGGAASVLAAALMIMDADIPINLRVLIPAVENSIAGDAFRPGDIFKSRQGLTVEIGNTDAEGRLILADTLAYADEDEPDLLIDMATLTGAARVALGPDLPALMTPDDALSEDAMRLGMMYHDPVWRLPLWPAYTTLLASKNADVNNVSSGSYAGSILAGLFLQKFVTKAHAWMHLDIFGWTPAAKPGRPEGGEAQGARLVYALVKERYGI